MPQLAPREIIDLRDALFAAFPTANDLWGLVANPLDKNHQAYVNANDSYPDQIWALLEAASSQWWALDLLDAAAQVRQEDPDLSRKAEAFRFRLLQARLDPYETCCLTGTNLLFNRKGLRNALRDLARPGGKRILVVRDEQPPSLPGTYHTKTGKSHTVHFVGHLRGSTDAFKTASIDLVDLAEIDPSGSGAQIQPSDVAVSLFELMKLDTGLIPGPPTDAQWSRWVHQCSNRFEAALRTDPSNWWIVIDGFNAVILPQPTLDLVKRIAKVVSLSLDNVRLVLLGYGDTFPLDTVAPYVEIEELCVALQVGAAVNELGHFFARACLEQGIEPTPDRVADLVAESLKDINAPQIQYQALVPIVWGCLKKLEGCPHPCRIPS